MSCPKPGAVMSDIVNIDSSIVHDAVINGVVVRLYENGTLLLQRPGESAFIFPWLTDLESGKSWVPERDLFLRMVRESLDNDDYDFSKEESNCNLFVSCLKDLLKNAKDSGGSTHSPAAE